MKKASKGDIKETQPIVYTDTELKRAISIVNAEVFILACQIKQYFQAKKQEKVVIKGSTNTNFPAEILADPSDISEIVLNNIFLMNYVLKSEFPREMWLNIIELVGLDKIEHIDFPFPIDSDDTESCYISPFEA